MARNTPTLHGLNEAVKSAALLLDSADKNDAAAYASCKESLRKAKENLRVFIYRQKGRISISGKSIHI
jgi:hypothetical protein